MTKKIETIQSHETVFEACNKYKKHNVGSLVVVKDEIIVGIITERDVIEKVVLKGKNTKITNVGEIMTPNLKTIPSLSNIEDASNLMKEYKIKKLPVVYNDNLVGIITETDISHAIQIISKNDN